MLSYHPSNHFPNVMWTFTGRLSAPYKNGSQQRPLNAYVLQHSCITLNSGPPHHDAVLVRRATHGGFARSAYRFSGQIAADLLNVFCEPRKTHFPTLDLFCVEQRMSASLDGQMDCVSRRHPLPRHPRSSLTRLIHPESPRFEWYYIHHRRYLPDMVGVCIMDFVHASF
jgi:hypothetical protein